MKTPEVFLASLEIKHVQHLLQIAETKRQEASYNLFTLSSHNSQKENFHSDVIASLLNPNGLHKEENEFMLKFIVYLNTQYNKSINPANYTNAQVYREKGRIDIWIKDTKTKHCIIIENKMNNAGDMEDQLQRYYNYAEATHNVDAIVYLSLDGMMTAPEMSESQKGAVLNIGAYTAQADDLINGWLEPCYEISTNDDSRSLIYQYIKLIKHLNQQSMNAEAMDTFYKYISVPENYAAAISVNTLSANIGTYRRDIFSKRIGDHYTPFQNKHNLRSWNNCGTLFEYYEKDGFYYKLDVYFENNGNSKIRLWTPKHDQNSTEGRQACIKLLEVIEMADGFVRERNDEENSMIEKWFLITEYNNMHEVDNAVYSFMKKLLDALNK